MVDVGAPKRYWRFWSPKKVISEKSEPLKRKNSILYEIKDRSGGFKKVNSSDLSGIKKVNH